MLIRTILEGYLDFLIQSNLNFLFLSCDNTSDCFASILAVLLYLSIIIFPLLSIIILFLNQSKFESETFEKKYGSLYEGIYCLNKRAILFTSFNYCIRRFIFGNLIWYSQNTDVCIVLILNILLTLLDQIIFEILKPLIGWHE